MQNFLTNKFLPLLSPFFSLAFSTVDLYKKYVLFHHVHLQKPQKKKSDACLFTQKNLNNKETVHRFLFQPLRPHNISSIGSNDNGVNRSNSSQKNGGGMRRILESNGCTSVNKTKLEQNKTTTTTTKKGIEKCLVKQMREQHYSSSSKQSAG